MTFTRDECEVIRLGLIVARVNVKAMASILVAMQEPDGAAKLMQYENEFQRIADEIFRKQTE
jgi:hypothetical protein